jgi:hypothetical protein
MAKPTDRKARKAKARQEAIRKQKATTTAQPRLFRQNPGLAEALSARHPLVGYFVNQDWTTGRMASVHVIREAESGQVFAGFLVDLMWRGTKDAYGRHGLIDALAELQSRIDARHPEAALVPLDKDAAVNVIRGGIAWARQWRLALPADLDIWLRLVDPAPAWGLDMGIFGDASGHPIVMGTPEEVARIARLLPPGADIVEEAFDEEEEFAGEEAPPRPGGLWLPGDNLWGAEDAEPPEEEPRGPGGLWLPGS